MWTYEVVTMAGRTIEFKADTVTITASTVIFKSHGITVAEFYINRISGWVCKR